MRVAALIDTVQVSGPGRQLAALAHELAKADVDLVVITFHRIGRSRSPYLDYLDRAKVCYIVVPESGPFDARLIARLRRALAQCAPDVVQTHGYKPAALAYALRRGGARWPWIAFFHGATAENLKTRFYHWLDRRIMARADRIVVMSRRHHESFSRLGAKVSVVHNAVLPLGTTEDDHGGATLEDPVDQGMPRPLIGVVGRLSHEKGVDVFLHACEHLKRRGTCLSALIAGDGPARRNLEELCDRLGLAEQIRFTGIVAAVHELYSRLDLLVIPSRSEGLPNVLLEALRADVPVVATAVGAIPEVIDSPLAGALVPPDDPRGLADAIERSLSGDDTVAKRAARRVVAERFSLERRVMSHLTLYADVLRRPDLRPSRNLQTSGLGVGGC